MKLMYIMPHVANSQGCVTWRVVILWHCVPLAAKHHAGAALLG